ncbi:MAG TPA: hypothetical protein VLD38_06285 [Nitrosopumilaceae archaeon]|nr:hypothetical protein [Nitrosopumilaceae archaeon]
MESEILKKISSSGLIGTKRIELKKTFGKNCEKILKGLIEKQEIIVEKKGNAYFVWTKENYISQRSQNDPKFILALRIATKSNNTKSEETNHIHNVQNTIQVSHQIDPNIDFKIEFDKCLTESPTSIGWMPFSQIRKKICESKHISSDYFYTLASDLVEKHRENYEVSSGGQEGIMMRGLVHGFVRNI